MAEADDERLNTWRTVVAALALVVLVAGWFFMSWKVMHTPPVEAAGEALGVAFGLLILVSVIGALRRRP